MKKTRTCRCPDLDASAQPLISLHLSLSSPSLHLSLSYRRTSETLSQAGLKATAAFSNVGSAISKKLEDVRSVTPQIYFLITTKRSHRPD